jgi:membrane-associated protease RseP (regulator of RpoE activity)
LDPIEPGFSPDPPPPRRRREHPLFHLLLLVLTFLTATLVGGVYTPRGGLLGEGGFFDGLPFSVPLLTILGVHELGHFVTCRRYGIAATLPYFLPSPLLIPPFLNLAGTFGALIRIKEPIRRKTVLFDVGVAGPIAGFVTAIPFLLYGVAHPRPSTMPLTADTPLFDYPLLARWAQHVVGVAPYTSASVHEHPTFMAAWFGLLVTCLNLLPVGQLDGGHALRAAAGKRQPLVSGIVLALCAAAGIAGSILWLLFPAIAVLVMGISHPPVEDDDQPLDFGRKLVGLACVAIFLVSFTLKPIYTP